MDAELWQSAWAVADTDGDGRISRDEMAILTPDFSELFDHLDADGDGFITPAEALAERSVRHAASRD